MTDASAAEISAPAHLETAIADSGPARSLGSDAWIQLRRRPVVWFAAAIIAVLVVMAAFPQLFTSLDPTHADLRRSRETPNANAWFGMDRQGVDIYARTIYGARASILVGFLTTVATMVIGSIIGIAAGYYGGWPDSLLSRVTDMFFAIPLLLGGILFMASFPNDPLSTPYWLVIGKVVLVMTVFGWTGIARLMRSSVIQVKPNEYVLAARALGASPWRIIISHVLPNAMAPVIVVSTINLGAFIATEATLSFLGIGLQSPAVSWGIAISDATVTIRSNWHMLFFPSLFLSITVLAFILLGDAVRDAFDPKTR